MIGDNILKWKLITLAAICDQPCQHGGQCVAPNECSCSNSDYCGNFCEISSAGKM